MYLCFPRLVLVYVRMCTQIQLITLTHIYTTIFSHNNLIYSNTSQKTLKNHHFTSSTHKLPSLTLIPNRRKMSQALVTDFFNTRKRNRFQDEAIINKSRKAAAAALDDHAGEEPTKRCLRSSKQKSTPEQEAPPVKTVVEVAPEKELKPKRGGAKTEKKDNLEALKSRMKRLDDAKSRVLPEPAPIQAEPVVPAAPPAEKKRVNKAELKRRIEEFNRNLSQLKDEKPVVEAEKPKETPVEAKMPAYLKSKDLASEKLDLASTLTLPKAYSMLLDTFKGSDTIVKFLFNRDEVCTFLKLKMGIQNITKQTFAHKHLAQIKAVYPEAYALKYEKLFIDFKNDYHLIIAPNMEGKLTLFRTIRYYFSLIKFFFF